MNLTADGIPATTPALLILGNLHVGATILLSRPDAEREGHPLLEPGFQDFLRRTTLAERNEGNIGLTIRRYETRLNSEESPERRAFLELRISRALERTGLRDAARDWDRRLLQTPSSVTDEFGLPIAYYVAEQLINTNGYRDEAATRLRVDLVGGEWISTDAHSYLADMMQQAGMSTSADSISLSVLEEEHRLAKYLSDRPSLLLRESATDPVWVAVPEQLWLVRTTDGFTESQPLVAVHFRLLESLLIQRGSGLRTGPVLTGEERTLAPHFPFLTATITPVAVSGDRNRNRFLLAGLFVLLLATLFGGYMLWRDVRRESRIAQLRTQFVSSVSHELRTPLTSIRLFAESMMTHGSSDPEERQRSLKIIANESERLTRMLNNVLNTSRIDQGTMIYRIETVELSEVVERAVHTMSYAFGQAGVDLAVSIEPVWIKVDQDAIEQALLNLLSNALKYAASGRSVSVTCSRNGTHAKLTVTDSGPGISSEDQRKIFDRFYRAESAEAKRATGAGLGLALVKHIAEGHAGRVTVESKEGVGSTFTIILPIDIAYEQKNPDS